MWTLIERYTIGPAAYGDLEKDKTLDFADFLKLWALDRTSKYANVKNFKPYPLAMCALLDSFAPDKVNFANLDPNDNAELSQSFPIVFQLKSQNQNQFRFHQHMPQKALVSFNM